MRTFDVTLDGCDVVFTCNKVSLRDFKKLIGIMEQIRKASVSTETLELIERGLAIGIASTSQPDKAIDELIDFEQSMRLIGLVCQGGRVSEEERKKSE
jgi:hypothetical protein